MLPNKLRQVFIYLDGQLRKVCVGNTDFILLYYFIVLWVLLFYHVVLWWILMDKGTFWPETAWAYFTTSVRAILCGFGAGGEATRAESRDGGESSIPSFSGGPRSSSPDRSNPHTSQRLPSRFGVCWEKDGSRPVQFIGKCAFFLSFFSFLRGPFVFRYLCRADKLEWQVCCLLHFNEKQFISLCN